MLICQVHRWGNCPICGFDAPTFEPSLVVVKRGWKFIHRLAIDLEDWSQAERRFRTWELISVPCGACWEHWREFKSFDPPTFESRIGFAWWSHRAHNAVSRRILKAVWSNGRFYRRYGLDRL